ncbi:MAG: hypothetical protein JST22_15295 [Bacteroidetes bacterium]|nr:hypothetical protein [Bacteroidota bacterium]
MSHHLRSILAACALAVFALLFASDIVCAQNGVPWGGCLNTTICNRSTWTMTLNLVTTPAGAIAPVTLVPGQCINVATPGVASIDFVISAAPIRYPVLPPPPVPPCTCPAGTWSVCCVTLRPQNWCADICFDPATCTITINNAICPAPCRP